MNVILLWNSNNIEIFIELFFVKEKNIGQKRGFFGTQNSYWTVIFVLLYKEWKTYSKRTFDYTDYDNVMSVKYNSNMEEVVLFDKIIKESLLFKEKIKVVLP